MSVYTVAQVMDILMDGGVPEEDVARLYGAMVQDAYWRQGSDVERVGPLQPAEGGRFSGVR